MWRRKWDGAGRDGGASANQQLSAFAQFEMQMYLKCALCSSSVESQRSFKQLAYLSVLSNPPTPPPPPAPPFCWIQAARFMLHKSVGLVRLDSTRWSDNEAKRALVFYSLVPMASGRSLFPPFSFTFLRRTKRWMRDFYQLVRKTHCERVKEQGQHAEDTHCLPLKDAALFNTTVLVNIMLLWYICYNYKSWLCCKRPTLQFLWPQT